MANFCEKYETLEQAQEVCECQCEVSGRDNTFYHCPYGNCCGYHCCSCDKFEVVN